MDDVFGKAFTKTFFPGEVAEQLFASVTVTE